MKDYFWNDIKVGNDSFRHTQFGLKASQTISQRRFLPKLKVCPSSVSSTNPSAQNSKLENNALDNTSLLLMYRRYNLLFYSQFTQFGQKASQTISQRRFLPKLKACPSSVSSTNPSAQISKLDILCYKKSINLWNH